MQYLGQVKDANFPTDPEGRTYHLGLKAGEVANHILMVGEPGRAALLRDMLDSPSESFEYHSHRGFLTFTGLYKGKALTIISIGMGYPMADFAVREMRAVVEGPMFIIRLGTCGTPNDAIEIGSVVTAQQSFALSTNYDAYHRNNALDKFIFSSVVAADKQLNESLLNNLKNKVPAPYHVANGTDATADSFYSSQGRYHHKFRDDNEHVISAIMKRHPDTLSLQMETFQIFHLARIGHDIRAAAAAIVIAQRHSNAFLEKKELKLLEAYAGEACLEALIQFA